jgi:hypothetical protein
VSLAVLSREMVNGVLKEGRAIARGLRNAAGERGGRRRTYPADRFCLRRKSFEF